MQLPVLTHEQLTQRYTTVLDAGCEIAHTYYFLGRFADAKRVVRNALDLVETGEIRQEDHLKLLLVSGQILTTEHLTNTTDTTHLFTTLHQARQIAESLSDQQGLSDALSLLGQAHYIVDLMAGLSSGGSPGNPQEEGLYTEALNYQQQALALREALHDTRGMSESHFHIGIVHERRGQRELALSHYHKAIEIAEQHGYLFERSEPTRHLAWDALKRADRDLDQALAYSQQALSLREEANFRPHLPFDHLQLGLIYQARGENENALHHVEIAARMAREMDLPFAQSLADDLGAQLKDQ